MSTSHTPNSWSRCFAATLSRLLCVQVGKLCLLAVREALRAKLPSSCNVRNRHVFVTMSRSPDTFRGDMANCTLVTAQQIRCPRLNGQGRLLVLCSRHCTESRRKNHQAFAVTTSIEFKEVITSTHLRSRKKENVNKAAESTDSLTKGIRSQGKVGQTLSSKWFELISPFQASSL